MYASAIRIDRHDITRYTEDQGMTTKDNSLRVRKEPATQRPTSAAEVWQGYVAARWLRPIKCVAGKGYNAYIAQAPNPNEHLAYALHLAGYKAGTWIIACRDEWFMLWAQRQLHWLAHDLQDYVRQVYGAEVAYRVIFTSGADIAY